MKVCILALLFAETLCAIEIEQQDIVGSFLKLLVFVFGAFFALAQIILYLKSLKNESVVQFAVFASQVRVQQPMKVMESDRNMGTSSNFNKMSQHSPMDMMPSQIKQDTDNIVKQMLREAQETLSARERRRIKSKNLNKSIEIDKSVDSDRPNEREVIQQK